MSIPSAGEPFSCDTDARKTKEVDGEHHCDPPSGPDRVAAAGDGAPVTGGSGPALKIAVHDFGGYAFPAELSRELARRGHRVHHLVCEDVFSGKADLQRTEADPSSLSFERVSGAKSTVRKYDPVHRLRWEWTYGTRLAECVEAFSPDVVLSANTPLVAQHRLFTKTSGSVARVIWLQDLVSVAIERHVAARSGAARAALGPALRHLELRLAQAADHVVAIAPHFVEFLQRGGVAGSDITEIRNWAPVADLPVGSRENDWRRTSGIGDDFLVVYSGTLGLKHDPMVLADIARRLGPGATVTVLAEGPGMETLRQHAAELPNLRLMSFVAYEELPAVLAAADVLVALLEPDASTFSVPSKVLTYLCSGRPVVASVPPDNLAATILRDESSGGVVVDPGDTAALLAAIEQIRADPARARRLGRAGREYAEAEFDPTLIAQRFEAVLRTALLRRRSLVQTSDGPAQPVEPLGAVR